MENVYKNRLIGSRIPENRNSYIAASAAISLVFFVLGYLAVQLNPILPIGALVIALGLVLAWNTEWGLLFLVAYLPFEDIILKYLPVSDVVYGASRYVSAVLVLGLFAVVVFRRFKKYRQLVATPIDKPLIIVGLFVFASAVYNRTDSTNLLMFLYSIIRYIFLFYAVANADLSERFPKRLVTTILAVCVIQAMIGIAQLIAGPVINRFLLPRPTDFAFAGYVKSFVVLSGAREIGGVFGAAGDTVLLALILIAGGVFALELALSRYSAAIKVVGIASFTLCSTALIYTYSRGAVIAYIIACITLLLMHRRFQMVVAVISIASVIILVAVIPSIETMRYVQANEIRQTPIENFVQSFTSRYKKEVSGGGRLDIITDVPVSVINHAPLLGHGPDFEPPASLYLLGDVYWVFLLYQIGVPAILGIMVIIVLLLYAAQQTLRHASDGIQKIIAGGFIGLSTAMIIYSFFGPAFEFRAVTAIFWLTAGLLCSFRHNRERIPVKRLTPQTSAAIMSS